MLNRLLEKLPSPRELAGIFHHVMKWLMAGFSDVKMPNPAFKGPGRGIAIYCIHGTADRNLAFQTLVNYMLKNAPGLSDKISAIHLLSFDSRFRGVGIDVFAEQVRNKILANGDTDVIILGHSRGGIVGAQFNETLARKAGIKVHMHASICSPHGGSPLALEPLASVSTSVRQMQSQSPYLKTQNKLIEQQSPDNPAHTKYYYVGASRDLLVPEYNSYSPLHYTQQRTFSNHGHLSIMSSELLAFQLQHWINDVARDAVLAPEKIVPPKSDPNAEMKMLLKIANLPQNKGKSGLWFFFASLLRYVPTFSLGTLFSPSTLKPKESETFHFNEADSKEEDGCLDMIMISKATEYTVKQGDVKSQEAEKIKTPKVEQGEEGETVLCSTQVALKKKF